MLATSPEGHSFSDAVHTGAFANLRRSALAKSSTTPSEPAARTTTPLCGRWGTETTFPAAGRVWELMSDRVPITSAQPNAPARAVVRTVLARSPSPG
jgi:hypothetical protein